MILTEEGEQHLSFALEIARKCVPYFMARHGIHQSKRADFESAAGEGVFKAISTYNPKKSGFKTYATLKINGALKDQVGYEMAKRRYGGNILPQSAIDNVQGKTIPRLDILEDILEDISRQFSFRDRIMINLYYLEGHTWLEISKTVGLSKSQVGQILKRAQGKLKKLLEKTA